MKQFFSGIIVLLFSLFIHQGLFAQTPISTTHWTSNSDSDLSPGTAGAVSTITIDTVCSQVNIQVTDTANAPLPPFNAYQFNPVDNMGNDVTDLSGNMRVYVRVRSLEDVKLAILLRSGGGTSGERTDRVEFTVPGDLNSWSEFVYEFTPANLAGFDSTDLRDIWFYLDRGVNNFAGNDFYIDYISLGASPSSSTFSTCTSGPTTSNPTSLYGLHWTSNSDPIFSGSAAATVNQTIDTICSQVGISVIDTANNPLSAFSALILNPKDSMGNELTDLSGNMTFHVRARSREDVMLGFLLRAGDGTSAFRSDLQEQLVPGDTASWTTLSFEVNTSNLGGFDSTDLRDIWFYLDRGTNNFAGNEFYFDYFYIGSAPDTALNSTCFNDTSMGPDPVDPISYVQHWESSATPLFGGSGAATLNQVLDSACSQLGISVVDPVNNPLDDFAALIVNPKDTAGNDIMDISGSTQIHARVRSKDSVRLGFLARSGDGSSAFRSDLQEVVIPGDTMNWTEVTFNIDASTIGGFDSTDLRDIWFYLDRGDDNFAGNEFYFDYVALGPKPDPVDNSPCSFLPPFEFPYLVHWADTADAGLSGTGAAQLTQEVDTACSQIAISVTDPVGDPHGAFKPMIINPKDDFGNDLADLSGQMKFYVRVRSAGEVSLGMVLRSGGGQTSERTEILEKTVPGDLTKWTELVYTFEGANLGGFDSTDLRDFWFYLNREEANFPGNEFYFDYAAIGSRPDSSTYSDCVESVDIEDLTEISNMKIYPNPSQGNQAIELEFSVQQPTPLFLSIYDLSGRMVQRETFRAETGTHHHSIQPKGLAPGMYTIQLVSEGKAKTIKWIIN